MYVTPTQPQTTPHYYSTTGPDYPASLSPIKKGYREPPLFPTAIQVVFRGLETSRRTKSAEVIMTGSAEEYSIILMHTETAGFQYSNI